MASFLYEFEWDPAKADATATSTAWTLSELTNESARIRLISARPPTSAEMRLPIYLDAEVQSYLAERAAQKGMPLSDMVNGLLRQEIRLIKSVK